ncbi:MAG: hypothetical protein QOJ50_3977 [Cryptosporangiaceae bacterium]|nr:hypothetical protein [Cryptosporangiaceae bacterium]
MNSATQNLLRTVLAERDQWLPTVRYDARQRWYQRLDITHHDGADGHQAWLLSWLPGQRTGLHDHGGAAGGFTVVTGSLREYTVVSGRGPARLLGMTRTPGRHRLFGEHHIHEVVNDSPEPAVSLHVYTPSLSTMTRYDWTRRGAIATAVESAGADW